ncbi:MAG TPA: SpoIIE family protein phosphatase [Desulfomonilia bacterium]|nr:SpoIIE family protein phosphatase [Desulfomonilia bacterium]
MKSIQNVLIIDPDKEARELTKKLSRKGFNTTLAYSSDDGLVQVVEKKPDLVILSLNSHNDSRLVTLKEIIMANPMSMVIVAAEKVDGFLALECMRLGVLDYLIKPVTIASLNESIQRILNQKRSYSFGIEPESEGVVREDKTIVLGNDLERIPYIINQAVLNAKNVCDDIEMLKMALGEILLNAIEHGNLGITMEEKSKSVSKGTYEDLLKQRRKNPKLSERKVTLETHMEPGILEYVIMDEGDGFDYEKEFNLDPNKHIGSGLGVQIAKSFFTKVIYVGRGNKVRLIYSKIKSPGSKDTPVPTLRDDFIVQLTKSFPSGLLVVSDQNRVILWNKSAQNITSIKSSELLGKTVEDTPQILKDLLNDKNKQITIEHGDFDLHHIEKSVHTVGPKDGGKYTAVLFNDVTDTIKQKEEMERLLMESAEARDLMEEQAAKLTITLAEMDEKNDIIRAQNQRMIEELEMAAKLQKSLLPDTFENKNGVSFTCKYIPSIHIGGDLYDVVDLGGGQTGFIIADVSGHGVAAALISSMFKMSFHALAANVASPTILMHMLNGELKPVLNEDYITAFFVLTDRHCKNITYSNAGHPTPLLFKRSTCSMVELDTGGFFLGSFEDGGYEEKCESNIEMGDALLMYTDCILETENEHGEQYGKERLIRCFQNAILNLRGNEVIDAIEKDVRTFNFKDTLDDDFTVMLLEFWEEVPPNEALKEEDAGGGFVEF